MTADKPHATDQGIEKQSVKPGDEPPAGTPITEKADNTIQQRLQERETLKAYRLTRDPNNAFAIDLGNGSEVKDKRPLGNAELRVAQNADSQTFSTARLDGVQIAENVRETNAKKLHTGDEVAEHAYELGEKHPDRWKNEGKHGEIRKCNLFVDAVFHDLGIPLPWEQSHIPVVADMKTKLEHSKDWEEVHHKGDSLKDYKPQPGDLVIWSQDAPFQVKEHRRMVTKHHNVQHSGVIGKDGEILYAGSGDGYHTSDFALMANSVAYGPPTAIFRSKHVKSGE